MFKYAWQSASLMGRLKEHPYRGMGGMGDYHFAGMGGTAVWVELKEPRYGWPV